MRELIYGLRDGCGSPHCSNGLREITTTCQVDYSRYELDGWINFRSKDT